MVSGLCVLTACGQTNWPVDNLMRRTAKTTVIKTLVEYYPSLPNPQLPPATDCIVDNAGPRDVRELAGDSVTGVRTGTYAMVKALIERPEVNRCLDEAGLATLVEA